MDVTLMDPKTAKVAVKLQLADINDLLDGLYDKEDLPDGDARASFQVTRHDLQRQLQTLEGQVLTFKILKEEHENRVAFSRLLEEEKRAVSDHQLAMRLAGLTVTDPDIKRSTDYEASLCDASDCGSDEQWEMAKELYAAAFEREIAVKLNTNSKILGSSALTKCCACMEVLPSKDMLILGCKPEPHTYCRTCLVDLFTSALVNTTPFPPRCCKLPIPLETCCAILPKELIMNFDLKVQELATPNPTYCSNAECSKFIRLQDIKADIASCVYCKDRTCVQCKSPEHKGLCPSDPHVQLLMDITKRSRWQQCTKCKNMVELERGCFHMICRCRHEFCYLCGVRWKTCGCLQADEEYLIRPPPAIPAAQVLVPAELPPARHEHDWRRVNGADCGECGADYLPFVMRCNGCHIANCWRCIHNRE